ncbi:hypothetical protein O6H91_14G003200 [Diphasiastrum complanatum]|uniref:Uncharacterized protein n=1 Tax=Diphasiastrum complanatum TaxID=34168 RepID=A0ACC2BKX1_DIPCM|nr:hypothetical protein O6H91_14G003200 [Diphasiastrum complanatum]
MLSHSQLVSQNHVTSTRVELSSIKAATIFLYSSLYIFLTSLTISVAISFISLCNDGYTICMTGFVINGCEDLAITDNDYFDIDKFCVCFGATTNCLLYKSRSFKTLSAPWGIRRYCNI